ncbi:SDR family oxidoreductase [Arenicella sp. 4NH20-0111]|uniref:SDR family NAD(P)-dependent oxidoreductase n=1 Tax=Arenicella sp. 4NH20-0111 TaxID=3127648 RepID=UPI0031033878
MKRALLIGSNGTIGEALSKTLHANYEVHLVSRDTTDYSDASLSRLNSSLKKAGDFSVIICCVGSLHDRFLNPEKRLSDLSEEMLMEYFRVNTVIPSLCLKHFSSLLDRTQNAKFVVLSAMVGSIAENSLGGWYGYRSSKAALNMMIKTASIEVNRTNKNAAVIAIHPGTTIGRLSKPFAAGIDRDKYYTPEVTAHRIVNVVESLSSKDSGLFFNWDGRKIAW